MSDPLPRIRVALVSLAIASALCIGSSAMAGECAAPRLENTVRMEPIGDQGEVAVPIFLNRVEKKFLFDTGGGAMNYVSSALAQHLGLPKTDNFEAMDLAGNKSYSVGIVRNLKFGAVSVPDILFQVVPDLAFDGILSAGTMTNDDLDIDFGAIDLNFFSAEHCPGDVVYWPHPRLRWCRSLVARPLRVAVTLDGHALTAVIDTGSSWTILNVGWAGKICGFSAKDGVAQVPGAPKDNEDGHLFSPLFRALLSRHHHRESVADGAPRPVWRWKRSDAPSPCSRSYHRDGSAEASSSLLCGQRTKSFITPAASGPSSLPKRYVIVERSCLAPEYAALIWDPIHRPH